MLGAKFNDKHTYKDYGFVIGNSDIVGIPKPKLFLIEIPGSSEIIDLSEALTGRVEYESRTLKFKLGGLNKIDEWASVVSNFLEDVHGKKVKVILDDDIEYYYIGRCTVTNYERSLLIGELDVEVLCEPYKWEITSSDEDWLWDSFNFNSGIIREYKNIRVDNEEFDIFIPGSSIPITPSFYVETENS